MMRFTFELTSTILTLHEKKQGVLDRKKIIIKLLAFNVMSVALVGVTMLTQTDMYCVCNRLVSDIWVCLTNTGGTIGIGVILLVACFVLMFGRTGTKKWFCGVQLFLFLVSVVGITAFFNEYILKERLKVHRPSIELLQEKTALDADELYSQKGKANRRKFLKAHFELNNIDEIFIGDKKVSESIVKVWMKETGFSFPSGHSVSAFLVVSLLAYIIWLSYGNKYVWMVLLCFAWAIVVACSRVVIGVHTCWDVTLGAAWGSLVAYMVILSGTLEKLLVRCGSVKI